METHGFYLNKSDFRDALCLRYDWSLSNIPRQCHCGKIFSVDHAMICPTGGFPTLHHNEIRDLTASLLSEVCHSVAIEHSLQPLNGERLSPTALPMLMIVLVLMSRPEVSGRLTRIPL